MAIGNAVQRGSFVHVYDERGRQLCTISAGSFHSDGLKGYTGSIVNVRRGWFIYSYNERGQQIPSTSAG
jgi:hypothetical protein